LATPPAVTHPSLGPAEKEAVENARAQVIASLIGTTPKTINSLPGAAYCERANLMY